MRKGEIPTEGTQVIRTKTEQKGIYPFRSFVYGIGTVVNVHKVDKALGFEYGTGIGPIQYVRAKSTKDAFRKVRKGETLYGS